MDRLLNRLIARVHRNEEGITGLETAIVLIAFIMVASVFAYVVTSAGLYSSQKAKQAITAGLEATMCVIELKGDVIAKMENSEVKEIYLFVGTPAAGSPVDFTTTENGTIPIVISYMDAANFIPTVNWTMQKLSTINSDDLLDKNELFLLTVDLSSTANVSIGPYHQFTLEVKPPGGPVLPIERSVPGRVSQYVNMH